MQAVCRMPICQSVGLYDRSPYRSVTLQVFKTILLRYVCNEILKLTIVVNTNDNKMNNVMCVFRISVGYLENALPRNDVD